MSNDDALFTFGMLTALLTACVAGFGIADSSYPWEHEAAVKSCINNGGYESLNWDFELFQTGDALRYKVICNDGAIFYYNNEGFTNLYKGDDK